MTQQQQPLVVWLVGPPGVGKTTLTRALLGMGPGGVLPPGSALVPKPKWTVCPHLVAAGHYTGATFDGADTVPYNGAAEALSYWKQHLQRLPTLLDGDRFSNSNVLGQMQAAGVRLGCVYLYAADPQLEARRAARGSNQNAVWLRGRATKAQRFADSAAAAGATVLRVDGSVAAPHQVAQVVGTWLDALQRGATP